MFINQILECENLGNTYFDNNQFDEASLCYRQARGGIRDALQLGTYRDDNNKLARIKSLLPHLTVTIVSCAIAKNSHDLSKINPAVLQELSTECQEAALQINEYIQFCGLNTPQTRSEAKRRTANLAKENQHQLNLIQNAFTVQQYNDGVEQLNQIDWSSINSINDNTEKALAHLSLAEQMYRNGGDQGEADITSNLIANTYERRGDTLVTFSENMDEQLKEAAFWIAYVSYKGAFKYNKEPQKQQVLLLSVFNTGDHLINAYALRNDKEERTQLCLDLRDILDREGRVFAHSTPENRFEMLYANFHIYKELHDLSEGQAYANELQNAAGKIRNHVQKHSELQNVYGEDIARVFQMN